MTASRSFRVEKVRKIFQIFDTNGDGGLSREEMAALVVAVNPRVRFSDAQITAILDEVFRTYAEFIHPSSGLTLHGLLRTYDDGAGDVDRDFDALSLSLSLSLSDFPSSSSSSSTSFSSSSSSSYHSSIYSSSDPSTISSLFDDPPVPSRRHSTAPLVSFSPNHGVAFDSTWHVLGDLEILIKRLFAQQIENSSVVRGESNKHYSVSEVDWSQGIESAEQQFYWDESSSDYAVFVKDLNGLRARADISGVEEAFDSHLAMGRSLFEHRLYREALVSFLRSGELFPADVRPHFRAGTALYALCRLPEAKEKFILALECAESSGNRWVQLLPQVHVNLGIIYERDGMVLNACEHYREAAILCPTHYRALKLLGSALFGVGEYHAAEKALKEAILLRSDFADAHCDLGSVFHALGENCRATQEYQKAIDLNSGHVDALYNLGGLFMDEGRFFRALEMYTRVLALRPNCWRAQLNKAVALLGAGESTEASRALKEAFKMTKRMEVYNAVVHLNMLQKKRKNKQCDGNEANGEAGYHLVEPSKFKRVGKKTTLRQNLALALEIRAFQRLTGLGRCDIQLLKGMMSETSVPLSYSAGGAPLKSIRKADLEVILHKMLQFLKAEAFQGSLKAINEKVLSLMDASHSGRVDLGMFFAVIAPICTGPIDTRKKVVFDALLWRKTSDGNGIYIGRSEAILYLKLLRAVFIPSHGVTNTMEVREETGSSRVSFVEFLEMFDGIDCGFAILSTLAKLEAVDLIRHGQFACSICQYPIVGLRFMEVNYHFSLCSHCYSEGKVPLTYNEDEYRFMEYGNEVEAMQDKFLSFNLNSKSIEIDP